MSKLITIQLEIEDDELQEFLEREDVDGSLDEWLYATLCQNEGLGLLTACKIVTMRSVGDE